MLQVRRAWSSLASFVRNTFGGKGLSKCPHPWLFTIQRVLATLNDLTASYNGKATLGMDPPLFSLFSYQPGLFSLFTCDPSLFNLFARDPSLCSLYRAARVQLSFASISAVMKCLCV